MYLDIDRTNPLLEYNIKSRFVIFKISHHIK